MPRWKEYEACVEVDGKPLPEYEEVFGIAANGTPCVLVWIPSESGKSFKIVCRDSRSVRSANAYVVEYDGVPGETLVLRANYGPFAKQSTRVCFDDAPTKDGRRALVFADVKASGSVSQNISGGILETMSAIGDMRVRVLPVEVTARSADKPVEYAPRHELPMRPYLEHLKVPGLHRVRYGEQAKGSAPTRCMTKVTGPSIVTFVFKYCPLSILQARGVALAPAPKPIAPSPVSAAPPPLLVIPPPVTLITHPTPLVPSPTPLLPSPAGLVSSPPIVSPPTVALTSPPVSIAPRSPIITPPPVLVTPSPDLNTPPPVPDTPPPGSKTTPPERGLDPTPLVKEEPVDEQLPFDDLDSSMITSPPEQDEASTPPVKAEQVDEPTSLTDVEMTLPDQPYQPDGSDTEPESAVDSDESDDERDADDRERLAELQEEYECLRQLVVAQEQIDRLSQQSGIEPLDPHSALQQQQEKFGYLKGMKRLLDEMRPLKKRKRAADAASHFESAPQRTRLA